MDNVLTQTERPADCAELDVIISRGIQPHQRIPINELIADFDLHRTSCHECELIAAWDLENEQEEQFDAYSTEEELAAGLERQRQEELSEGEEN